VRNRIHTVIARQRKLAQPLFSDLFGKKGLHWLKELDLPAPDGDLLRQDLRSLDLLGALICELEKQIAVANAADPAAARLQSLPGVGPILACVIAAEIDGIERFRSPSKLSAYAGLVPTTHSSGGKTYHGTMLPFANRWLKWAFVEASWVAIGVNLVTRQRRGHRLFVHRQATQIVVRTREPVEAQLDGDAVGPKRRLSARVLPRALPVRLSR